jgi:hypothetical protein
MRLPETTLLTTIVKLGGWRAHLLAADGHAQAAADQLADLLWMDRHMADAPMALMLSLRQRTMMSTLAVARDLLADGSLDGADLSRMEAALDGEDFNAEAVHCLDGEAAWFGEWIYRGAEAGGVFGGGDGFINSLVQRGYTSILLAPLRRDDEATYLRVMAAYRDEFAHGQPIAPIGAQVAPEWGLARMLIPNAGEMARNIASTRLLLRAATLALIAQRGGAPVAEPGIMVDRAKDGSWTITADNGGWNQVRTVTWQVPAHRAP